MLHIIAENYDKVTLWYCSNVVVYCQVQFGALCGFISTETLSKHCKEMICLEQFSPPGI